MKFINYYKPNFGRLEIAAVKKVIQSGWVQTGPVTRLFGEHIKKFCRASDVQLTNSATAGLFLTLESLEIGVGDEVITTPYTFVATANVILQTGATVVFADPEDGYNLGPTGILKKMTPKTKAIICVDFAGVPCNYIRIRNELKKHYLGKKRPILIADASHSFGSSQEGIPSGSNADFTIFSFHAVKNISTVDGGAIVANRHRSDLNISWDTIFERIRRKSLHGLSHDAYSRSTGEFWEYDVPEVGYKYNMTDITASLGIVQLQRLQERKIRRQKILMWYKKELKIEKNVQFWEALFSVEIFPHILPIQVHIPVGETRETLLKKIQEKGVVCNVHYKPIPLMTHYQKLGYSMKELHNASFLYKNEITLPLYEQLTYKQVKQVAKILKDLLSR